MSEQSETYSLRTADQQSGIALLVAAGLRGFVYPPKNGWVTLLVDVPMGELPTSLIAHNAGILVRYIFAEDFGWEVSIWNGPERIAHYECGWEKGGMTVKHDSLSQAESANFVLPKPDDPGMLHAIHEILHPQSDDFRLPRPPVRFLELTGLPNSEWSSYDYLLGEYDEGDPEFAGVCQIDATAPTPMHGQQASSPISERLHKALVFPKNLRGDDAAVRRSWSQLIRKAWKAGTWSDLLSELEFVSVVEDIPLVISSPESFQRPRGNEYWRPYWIGILLDQIACKAEQDNEQACERFDRLALEGLEYFWFALGILETSEMCFPPKFFMPSASRTPPERSCAYLEKFLKWLGPLAELRPLMWNYPPWMPVPNEAVGEGSQPSPQTDPQHAKIIEDIGAYLLGPSPVPDYTGTERLDWAGNLFALCHDSGLVEPNALTAGVDGVSLARKHRFDAISMLLDLNVFQRDGDAFVLKTKT